MNYKKSFLGLLAPVALAGSLFGQNFSQVQAEAKTKLDQAVSELGALQTEIAKEKIPLAKTLNALKEEVSTLDKELKRLERLRDSRDVNISALQAEIKARRDEMDYAQNLMIEFITNQNAGSDASERQLYEEQFVEYLALADAPATTPEESIKNLETLVEGVNLGLDRLNTLIGGHKFSGKAVLPNGNFEDGTFVLYGPITYFSSDKFAGITQQGESGQPTLLTLEGYSKMGAAITAGKGEIPLDPTQGKALALATTKDSLLEHIQKGGFWIYPILGIAVIALIIAIFKLLELVKIDTVPKQVLIDVLGDLQAGNNDAALQKANAQKGDGKELLLAAVRNVQYGKDVVEQSLEEVLMRLQPKLDRLLSMIWITASTAPLLGLLGTVTGIITTFKLLTIFGSGDPKALGGGISEALITTEFGLIVAIPALVLHALLSRMAKSKESEFENDAMALLNGVARVEKKQ